MKLELSLSRVRNVINDSWDNFYGYLIAKTFRCNRLSAVSFERTKTRSYHESHSSQMCITRTHAFVVKSQQFLSLLSLVYLHLIHESVLFFPSHHHKKCYAGINKIKIKKDDGFRRKKVTNTHTVDDDFSIDD
jgi:hypothetical protein